MRAYVKFYAKCVLFEASCAMVYASHAMG